MEEWVSKDSHRVYSPFRGFGGGGGQDYGVAAGRPELSSAPSLLPHGKAEQ